MLSFLRRSLYEIVQAVRGRPSAVFVDITERCELHCRMCRFWTDGDHDSSRELDAPALEEMLRQARRDLGVRRLRFLGGEPFLHPDLLRVVAHARALGMNVNVVTNGWSIDAEVARRIVASGLDSIRISIDGLGADHDRLRGRPDSFARATAAVRHLLEARRAAGSARPEIQVFTLVTALNPGAVDAVRAWAHEQDPAIRHFWGPLVETTPAQVRASTWEGRALADGFHLPFARSLAVAEETDHALRASSRSSRLARIAARLGLRPYCPEAHYVHMDGFGHVKFCAYYRRHAYGVFPQRPLREIWFSRQHLRFLHHVRDGSLPMCRDLCGVTDRFFEGNALQLSRQLVLALVPSPLRARSERDARFVHEPEERTLPHHGPAVDEVESRAGRSEPAAAPARVPPAEAATPVAR